MAAFIALLCFLLILNQSSSLVNASVSETCKAIGFNYDFCVATLNADPKSASADTQGLAIIATNISKANATSTESTISILLKKTKDNKTSECLNTCSSMYSDLIDRLNDTITAITSKRYFDAKIYLSAAVGVGDDCETQFAELKVKSPLTKENDDSQKLSGLALGITSLLG
ncbi:putative invertase inhibitor [Elaeis guineensis]|uniref:Invertase inhibitor n=1 Tax=Elaeis guineensis var. tenera TaxID=51953 RepID=A0A6I9QBJ5_ELAGV|nr:putative invertase inhibitor [Elaeis guineensis]